jgi:hypothetical protein
MKSSILRRLPTMLEHRFWGGWMAISRGSLHLGAQTRFLPRLDTRFRKSPTGRERLACVKPTRTAAP